MSGVRKVTTSVPAGPRNSVGFDRGLSSAYVLFTLVELTTVPLALPLILAFGDFEGMISPDLIDAEVLTLMLCCQYGRY